jgi:cytidylate kinase
MSSSASEDLHFPGNGRRHLRVIAIDGPAAAGKTTVAYQLADRLGALLFDTGALYRVIAHLAITSGTSPDDGPALSELARTAHIELLPPSCQDGRLYDVLVDGHDVTWTLRSPDVGAIVSRVSRHPEVRQALLPLQRRIAATGPVVMAGRDVGTVVVPTAGIKVYLDASPEERAKRRYEELRERGSNISYDDVLSETLARDVIDSTRSTAPLRAASDALVIKTDELTAEEVVTRIERVARAMTGPSGESVWPT